MARKTKLTPDVQRRIVKALSVGATHAIACDYAGIHHETFYTWLDKGAEGRAPYVEFLEQVKLTQGRAAVGWLSKIEKAANAGTWQAAAWKLERRHTDDYGRTITKHEGEIVIGVGLSGLLAELNKDPHGNPPLHSSE